MARIPAHGSISTSPAREEPYALLDVASVVRTAPNSTNVRTRSPTICTQPANETERRTLLTGMRYEIAASHSDPRAFFERMVHQYGLKLKPRA